MKHLSIAMLTAIAFLASAGATDPSEGHVFSGVERMIFQNGISPTPDYAGIVMVGISSDSLTVTKGNMSWAGDSLVWIGDVNGMEGEDRILFSIDVSAIPDSCVIVDATLYVLKTTTNYTTNEYPTAAIHRLLRPFATTATWTNRKTSPADTAWSPAGAIMGSTRARWPSLYGMAEYCVGAPRVEFHASASGLPSYAGFKIACGADSLWDGYSQVAAYQCDALYGSDLTSAGRWNLGLTNDVWVPLDITHLIRMWHQRFWANYGAILALSRCDIATGVTRQIEFHGYLPATWSGGGANPLTPWVVVHYLHCAW